MTTNGLLCPNVAFTHLHHVGGSAPHDPHPPRLPTLDVLFWLNEALRIKQRLFQLMDGLSRMPRSPEPVALPHPIPPAPIMSSPRLRLLHPPPVRREPPGLRHQIHPPTRSSATENPIFCHLTNFLNGIRTMSSFGTATGQYQALQPPRLPAGGICTTRQSTYSLTWYHASRSCSLSGIFSDVRPLHILFRPRVNMLCRSPACAEEPGSFPLARNLFYFL